MLVLCALLPLAAVGAGAAGRSAAAPAAAIFGDATVGSGKQSSAADRKRATKFALAENGAVTDLFMHLDGNGSAGSGSQAIRGVIYGDSGGAPGSLLCQTQQATVAKGQAPAWVQLAVVGSCTLSPGNYWLGHLVGGAANVLRFSYKTASAAGRVKTDAYADGPSDPFGSASSTSHSLSMYASYTPVGAPNTAPSASSSSATTDAGVPVTVTLDGSDPETCELTFSIVGGPAHGTLGPIADDGCSPGAPNQDRASVLYTPNAGSGGTDSFTFKVNDGANESSPATVSITITGGGTGESTFGNTTPGGSWQATAADRKRATKFSLSESGDVGDLFMYLDGNGSASSGAQAVRGLVYADGGGAPGTLLCRTQETTVAKGQAARWVQLPISGTCSLGPGSYWLGHAVGATSNVLRFSYTNVSGSGRANSDPYADGPSDPFGSANTTAHSLAVYARYARSAAVNRAPIASAGSSTTTPGGPATITLKGRDAETCELAFAIASGPTSGTLSAIGDNPCTTATPNQDAATVVYTPADAFTGSDSFTFTVSDGDKVSNAATIQVTVANENAAPTATGGSARTLPGDPVTITLTGSDAEACELSFSIATPPGHGNLGMSEVVCTPGTPNTDTVAVVYSPASGFTGTDSFTFTTDDGLATSPAATVDVIVKAGPVASPGSATTPPDTPVTITLVGLDNVLCELGFAIVDQPVHGTLGRLGDLACMPGSPNSDHATVSYTPATGFKGTDSFTFLVDDGVARSAKATVTVGVDWIVTADFAATDTSGDAPFTVSFADRSSGSPASWRWDFGDGGTSTAPSPSHTYARPGTYTVSLTASNAAGFDKKIRIDYIRVAPGATGVDPLRCKGYPEKRIFLEAQAWWLRTPGKSGTDHGHVHVGTCFPHAQHVSGVVDLDIRVILHDNPGTVHTVSTGGVDTGVHAVVPTNFSCPHHETCTFWVHVILDVSKASHQGRIESRFHAEVREPDGAEQLVTTGWQWYWDVLGKPVKNYRASDVAIARGWYAQQSDFGYQNATLRVVPLDPVSGTWTPSVVLAPGAAGGATTHHFAAIDPCFHCMPEEHGTVLKDAAGSFDGTLSIDTTMLSNGPHRLFLRTDRDERVGSTNSGVLVVPFIVEN